MPPPPLGMPRARGSVQLVCRFIIPKFQTRAVDVLNIEAGIGALGYITRQDYQGS